MNEYINRNSGWAFPMIAALIIFMAPVVLEMAEIKPPIPEWVTMGIAAVAFCLSGFIAAFVDTLSAKIMRFLAQIFAIGLVVLLFY
ncbi:TPA: hypothetical protein MDW71_005283 [Klebsiella pneumoniae]|nr:hypothetical protein [Klebsiella pneumoniae]